MENLKEKIEELEKAKKAVLSCLEKDGVWVDMKGISYWAKRVEDLRKEIKEML